MAAQQSSINTISLEHRDQINVHLNLILNYEACKLSERFSKFVLAIFPAKAGVSFVLTGRQLLQQKGLVVVAQKGPFPVTRRFGELNDNDPEGDAGYLTR